MCTAMVLVLRTVPLTRQQQSELALGNDELGASAWLSTTNDNEGPVSWWQPFETAPSSTVAMATGRRTCRAHDRSGLVLLIAMPSSAYGGLDRFHIDARPKLAR
jgi:hypothetical protein